MDSNVWYDRFLEALYAKYPKRAKLTEALMDLLFIEREAVYRRLRKDVTFSIHEVVKISSAWNISLDEISGTSSGDIPFLMKTINYLEPSEHDMKFLRHVIRSVSDHNDFPDTEVMNVCNKLPRKLYSGFKYLNLFYLFKWKYNFGSEKKAVPFSQITSSVSEEWLQLSADYFQALKNVPHTIFIFDPMIFNYMVDEIRYFHSIRLITDEEKEFIRKDLHDLLHYLSDITAHAAHLETQNKVSIYISHLPINTNYSYTSASWANVCFIHAFEKYDVYSYHPKMVENFKMWMQLKKRKCIQISGVDEKSRVEFFSEQHQIVDMLF